jgi:hypothetical protein
VGDAMRVRGARGAGHWGDLDFPPQTEEVSFTMKFLGYTHVKPVHRQWEIP